MTAWACDVCQDKITGPERGILVWREEGGWDEGNGPLKVGFLVVHKSGLADDRRCDPGSGSGHTQSLEISAYLGDEGRARLLSYLGLGPLLSDRVDNPRPTITDFLAYVDLFHRFQTPWYEEARPWFGSHDAEEMFSDSGPVSPYTPGSLHELVAEIANRGE